MTFLPRPSFYSSVRDFLVALVGSALVFASVLSSASDAKPKTISLDSLTDEQATALYIKMTGSLEPATIYTWFSGQLWGIVPGTAAKPLVSFEGLAKSVWRLENGQITKQSYDIGYFGDLDSGKLLNRFDNPYTGKQVAPYHYAYGGGITRYSKLGKISDGKVEPLQQKWMSSGDLAWYDETMSASFASSFDPQEWPLASAGKEVYFGTSTTNTAKIADLLDTSKSNIPYTFFWTAINSWEPWLHMGEAPGYVMWRATGRKLGDLSEAPESIIKYVHRVQPNYFKDDQPWDGTRSTWADYRRDRKPAN